MRPAEALEVYPFVFVWRFYMFRDGGNRWKMIEGEREERDGMGMGWVGLGCILLLMYIGALLPVAFITPPRNIGM